MPFKSQQQRKFFYSVMPDKAKEWERHTSKKKLPKRVKEMPHISSGPTTIDLRIERYPISRDEKHRLIQATNGEGVVAPAKGGKFTLFSSEGERVATPQEVQKLPHLPKDWEKFVVREGAQPKLLEVYGLEERPAPPETAKAPPSKTLDPAKLHDPQGFMDSVSAFINRADSDLETLAHFADGHSKKGDPDTRNAMALVSKDIGAVSKAIEPPLGRLGRDVKNSGNAMQASKNAGPRDTRTAAQKSADTSAWQKAKRAWFPRG